MNIAVLTVGLILIGVFESLTEPNKATRYLTYSTLCWIFVVAIADE
jgi:hypothetical protein